MELIPFFQGTVDQTKELTELCGVRGLRVQAVKPPGGGGG